MDSIKMLERYAVDRAEGATAGGTTQLVVLILHADGREFAVAMSRVDAVLVAKQLELAAADAQQEAWR